MAFNVCTRTFNFPISTDSILEQGFLLDQG